MCVLFFALICASVFNVCMNLKAQVAQNRKEILMIMMILVRFVFLFNLVHLPCWDPFDL